MKRLSTALFSSLLLPLLAVTGHAAVNINGAGSTFAEPLYTRWMSDFTKTNKEATFNYQGVGSGAGMKQMLEGTIDFAGSDDPMKDSDLAKAKSPIIHVPIAIGAVVVSYNLPSVKETLKLSGPVLAKIFNGTINKWNAPEIAALNPGVKLPDQAIAVATRSDGSGTTAVFTEYLAKESKEWEGKNGKTVNWFPMSLGAKGNAGVTGLIKQNPGTVGYVELVYAVENKLPFAQIKNKAGNFVTASAESASAAGLGIKKEAVEKEFKLSLTNSAQKAAYPITSFTWMLVYEKMPKDKGTAIVKFAKWAMGDDAQKTAGSLQYAPIPKDVRAEVLKKLDKVQLN